MSLNQYQQDDDALITFDENVPNVCDTDDGIYFEVQLHESVEIVQGGSDEYGRTEELHNVHWDVGIRIKDVVFMGTPFHLSEEDAELVRDILRDKVYEKLS
jgi:hypothetical protein